MESGGIGATKPPLTVIRQKAALALPIKVEGAASANEAVSGGGRTSTLGPTFLLGKVSQENAATRGPNAGKLASPAVPGDF